MARRVDVLNCKPEELFLAVSQVEQQLAQKSLMTIGGRHKIPMQVLLMMSELKIPDTDTKGRLITPPEGTTLLSCNTAHWKVCGILPEYLPTLCRFSYTLPDDAEMFKSFIDVFYHQIRNGIQGCTTRAPPLSRGGRVELAIKRLPARCLDH